MNVTWTVGSAARWFGGELSSKAGPGGEAAERSGGRIVNKGAGGKVVKQSWGGVLNRKCRDVTDGSATRRVNDGVLRKTCLLYTSPSPRD